MKKDRHHRRRPSQPQERRRFGDNIWCHQCQDAVSPTRKENSLSCPRCMLILVPLDRRSPN